MPEIKIYYAPINSRTPARCNRRTGAIYINTNRWHEIEEAHRVFILLHEIGHIVLNTSNELLVDDWAQKQFIGAGYPLSESVRAVTSVLSGANSEQIERGKQALNNALKVDKMTNNRPQSISEIIQDHYESDSFLGLGKEAKERRRQKQDRKFELKQQTKLGKINVSQTLANQGVVNKSSGTGKKIGAIAGGVVGIAGSALGAGGAGFELGNSLSKAFGGDEGEAEQQQMQTAQGALMTTDRPAKKWYQTTGAIVGMVVVGLGVIVGTIILIRKKK